MGGGENFTHFFGNDLFLCTLEQVSIVYTKLKPTSLSTIVVQCIVQGAHLPAFCFTGEIEELRNGCHESRSLLNDTAVPSMMTRLGVFPQVSQVKPSE